MNSRKTIKHKAFSIIEKNQIVLLYLDGHMSYKEITKEYDLSSRGTLSAWLKQHQEHGTCVDNRGRGTKEEVPNKGRPRKHLENFEQLSKEQLIEKLRLYEDIKKSLAYLMNLPSNKSIKS